MVIQVNVCGAGGGVKLVDLCDSEEQFKSLTVLQLKEKIIEAVFSSYYDHEELRLIFNNKRLDDDSSLLSAYGVQHRSTIHMVLAVPGGGPGDPGRGDGGMGDKEG
uniref:Ubiquitin-like domain-containing protein n=1 Tax=Seriola dumerili TaxID=41447 RepID=A0A3B4TRG0_SERDU